MSKENKYIKSKWFSVPRNKITYSFNDIGATEKKDVSRIVIMISEIYTLTVFKADLHQDLNEILPNVDAKSYKMRIKLTENDLKTERTFKIFNTTLKNEEEIPVSTLIEILRKNGYDEVEQPKNNSIDDLF